MYKVAREEAAGNGRPSRASPPNRLLESMSRRSIASPVTATCRFSLFVALLGLGSCDNYVCVFGASNCTNGGGGGGGGDASGATFPPTGSWILDGQPAFVDHAPSGSKAHPETVVALEFSESLAEDSVQGAFELFDSIFSTAVPIIDPPPVVGDGRVVVLVLLTSLTTDRSFLIRMKEGAKVRDLTGQLVTRPPDGNLGDFVVPEEPPEEPTVIASWPPDDELNQSDIGEVVVFFDRKMTPGSFGASSWVVSVDGAPPANDPNPVPLLVTGGQVPITVTQAWRWRSIDSDGEAVSLGTGGAVEVVLSPDGSPLTADSGGELPPTTIAFDLAPMAAPVAVRKHPLAPPEDAIGEPNLSGSIPVLEVELAEPPEVGDELVLVLFGQGTSEDDPLQSLLRVVPIEEQVEIVEITPAQIDLLATSTPVEGRFGDGDLSIAVRHERGGVATAVRLVDADPETSGAQRMLFDVTAPVIEGLGPEGGDLDTFYSDLRGVVLSARASEEVRRAEVRLPDLGFDNGTDAQVAAADEDGFFLAQPVVDGAGEPLGIVGGNQAFSLQVFDRALNPAATNATGTFRQRGAVGPGALGAGELVDVHVFDAVSLLPLSDALVLSQQENGAVTDLGSDTSDASGNAIVPSAAVGRTVLTVVLAGHDRFTIHGLRSDRVHVPLAPPLSPARTAGSIRAALPGADVGPFTNFLGDSRIEPGGPHVLGVGLCTPDPLTFTLDCPFGPFTVRAERLGVQSFLSADFEITFGTFSAAAFLKAFELRIPLRPVDENAVEAALFQVLDLLSAQPAADQAVAVEEHVLDAAASGLGTLDGGPLATIEGVCPGIPGAVPVGMGAAFDLTADSWTLLGAYAGIARGGDDPANWGSLVTQGTLQPDLFLRAELIDEEGDRVGRRPRFSQTTGDLATPAVLVLRAPDGSSGGSSYDLVFDAVLTDAHSTLQSGLYRAVLTDSEGRQWTLWRVDELDGAPGTLTIHVPDLGADGLADGTIRCQLSAWTWPDFDPTAFLWSDIEREYDVFAHSPLVDFTQP